MILGVGFLDLVVVGGGWQEMCMVGWCGWWQRLVGVVALQEICV